MTDKQIEIGDKILLKLYSQEGEGDSIRILFDLKVEGYNEFDIRDTFEILIDKYDLIKRNKFTPKITLSLEGKDVANIKLTKYLDNITEEKRIKSKSLKRSISYPIWTISISIFAVVISLVFGIVNFCENGNNKINNKEFYTKQQIDSFMTKLNDKSKMDTSKLQRKNNYGTQ